MKKHGFTLIELLGVLVILALLALLVSPVIKKQVTDSREELQQMQIENIVNASKNWAADHTGDLPSTEGQTKQITLKDLQDGGYLPEDFLNTDNEQKLNENTKITITAHNNTYTYTVEESA